MIDLCLKSTSEAALAAALPMLRVNDPDEGARWLFASPTHAFDPDVAVFEGGKLVPGYYANLRLLDGAPERAAILAAAEPFVVTPTSPTQGFAGGTDDLPVPAIITKRQFAKALAEMGVITKDEALAFVKIGKVPAALQAVIDAIPDPDLRFATEMDVSGAPTFERHHPSTLALADALGWSDAQMNDLWRNAGATA